MNLLHNAMNDKHQENIIDMKILKNKNTVWKWCRKIFITFSFLQISREKKLMICLQRHLSFKKKKKWTLHGNYLHQVQDSSYT